MCARVRARAKEEKCAYVSVCVCARARANKPRKHRAVALSHDEAAVLGPEAQRDLACPLRRLVFI